MRTLSSQKGDLVPRDKEGKPYSVCNDAVNAEQLEATVGRLTVAVQKVKAELATGSVRSTGRLEVGNSRPDESALADVHRSTSTSTKAEGSRRIMRIVGPTPGKVQGR